MCSKADHGAEIRVTAFLYTIIEQIVNLFNAIIEQKNDIIAQKELLPRDGSSSQRGITKPMKDQFPKRDLPPQLIGIHLREPETLILTAESTASQYQ